MLNNMNYVYKLGMQVQLSQNLKDFLAQGQEAIESLSSNRG